MELLTLTSKQRESLFEEQSQYWKGALTSSQYCERNDRLFAMPYARNDIHSLGVLIDGTVASALDIVPVSMQVRENGDIRTLNNGHIASVTTRVSHQKKGLASKLLSWALESTSFDSYTLISNINPAFYAKHGFVETPHDVVSIESINEPFQSTPCSLNQLVDSIIKQQTLRLAGKPDGTLLGSPQLAYWDWMLERYRLFAEWANQPFEPYFGLESHQNELHPVCFAPDWAARIVDGLWLAPQCDECVSQLRKFTASFGWKCQYSTTPTKGGTPQKPMFRRAGGAQWEGVQMLEQW